ncbi:hypothetical protein DK880_00871 [Candidatus Cardinium hertigii]|uniref:Uncharacterized protein n=1 Tax=Candidatus Cardinium hertigii TaxID=247481 RepID=A0A2Z3LDI9_9BACT|nr:hypothetical protein DK880_00871 [Candidatus Cardinium hertigii]
MKKAAVIEALKNNKTITAIALCNYCLSAESAEVLLKAF